MEALQSALEDDLARQPTAGVSRDERATEALRLARYELHFVELLHARLESGNVDGLFELVGPADTVSRLVCDSMRIAAKRLAELADADGERGPKTRERLLEAATTAAAWVGTFVDCQAVEDFSLDPCADPALR